jgi:hypothetical protein
VVNATSVVKPGALQQLAIDLTQFRTCVAIVTETWFNSKHCDQLVNIDGYVLHRKDRYKKKGGGVAIYVRSDIISRIIVPHSVTYTDTCSYTEVLWVECFYNGIQYYVAGCYHPPKARYDDLELKSD